MRPQHTCSNCGSAEKYCAKGLCKPCYNRVYNAAHAEQIRVLKHNYSIEHRAEITAKEREKRRANPEKHRAEVRRWIENNPEKAKEIGRASSRRWARRWREANPERAREQDREYRRRWRDERPEDYRTAVRRISAAKQARLKSDPAFRAKEEARLRQYAKEHPERVRAAKLANKTIRRAAYVERIDSAYIYARDGGLCQICGQPVVQANMSLDHIVPLARGGKHETKNVRLTCWPCNHKRRHRGPAQMLLFG